MMKNAHLRRQDLKFELQRTTQYASAQILSPSLHLGIFDHKPGCPAKTINCAGNVLHINKFHLVCQGDEVLRWRFWHYCLDVLTPPCIIIR